MNISPAKLFTGIGLRSQRLTRILMLMSATLALLLGLVAPMPARAATSVVTNLNDSGPGSLRQAIADAAPSDIITFGVTGTITLTTGELLINKDLTLSGPGAAKDRKSTRLNSSHIQKSRMPSSA